MLDVIVPQGKSPTTAGVDGLTWVNVTGRGGIDFERRHGQDRQCKAGFHDNRLRRPRKINHSATAMLMAQPAPMHRVLASSP